MGRMGIGVLAAALMSVAAGCKSDRQFSSESASGAGGAADDDTNPSGGGGNVGPVTGGTAGKPTSMAGNGGNGGDTVDQPGGGDGGAAGEPGATTPDPTMPDPSMPTGMSPCSADEYDDGTDCQPLTICEDDEFEQSPPKPDQDRVCVEATQCKDDEYEKSPLSAEKNRECSPLTVCAAGSWVSTQPTKQANRACRPCASGSFSLALNASECKAFTECKSGETQSVAPSPTSDRVCSSCGAGKYESSGSCVALTVCSVSQYESTPATAVSDRKCTALTTCQPGSKQTAAPTTSTDRQCAACSSGTFSTTVNAAECVAWTKCGASQYESQAPTAQKDRACGSLTACPAGTHIKTAATATSDRVCEACTGQTFTAAENVGDCQPWSNCSAGSSATSGTASKDRVCTACPSGKFSTTQNAAVCAPWTVCGSNQNQTKAGTSTSDAVCVDKPVCSTAADRACTTDCPCASSEGVCTANNQCVSGATCVAGSGKKVGRAGNTCLATHCNNDTKDGTETSVDCGGECGCRATFETFAVKGLPADRNAFYAIAMSRDGKKFAGALKKGNLSYPGVMAPDGTVTALEMYGKEAGTRAISGDGNVVVAETFCANPPSCSDTTLSILSWTGSAAPKASGVYGNPRSLSSSGAIIAGDNYNSIVGDYRGYVYTAGKGTVTIDAISLVVAMTQDGQYVVGDSPSGGQLALWAAQTGNVTRIGSAGWSSISANGINGVGSNPTVIGNAYISASDSRVAFRWKGGVITELATLSSGNFINPLGVSSDGGTVVGQAGPSGGQQAFIWTDADKLRTVVDELRARGMEPALDFTLGVASYLSDDGKTIVGSDEVNTFWRVVLQ